MKFRIQSTSGAVPSGAKNIGIDECRQPVYVIEIKTLEDLVRMAKQEVCPVIVSSETRVLLDGYILPGLELYDDYRE